MKGVLLAGGTGSRLGELTRVVNKHLLPVGEWPMIYHPLKRMVDAGVEDICLVTNVENLQTFMSLLGDGQRHGCNLTYRGQLWPDGIAHALGKAEDFVGDDSCMVILGDNIFDMYLPSSLTTWAHADVFLYPTKKPENYGIAELDDADRIVGIEEKPKKPKSKMAVTGVYLYPPGVFEVIRLLSMVPGLTDITPVNNWYAAQGRLEWHLMKGYWYDAGTPETYKQANRHWANLPSGD